jgi:biotin transporter BioY
MQPRTGQLIAFIAAFVILCAIFVHCSASDEQQFSPYKLCLAVGETVKHALGELWLFYTVYKAILRL